MPSIDIFMKMAMHSIHMAKCQFVRGLQLQINSSGPTLFFS